jgi:hypothetical protein
MSSTFDKQFAELLRLDAARRGVDPAPVNNFDIDDDDEPDVDDMADIDQQLMRARQRYRRARNPDQLTDRHIEFARRVAAGQPPFAAAMTAPLKYRRRAVRSLVNTPAWQLVYQQLRHERSPTIEQLIEATRTRDPGVQPERPFVGTPGYAIRLRPSS